MTVDTRWTSPHIDYDQLRIDWHGPEHTRTIGERYGVSGEAIRRAARRLGLPPSRAEARAVDPYENELSVIRDLSRAHDHDPDTALTGGRWLPRPDGVLRWVPDQGALL